MKRHLITQLYDLDEGVPEQAGHSELENLINCGIAEYLLIKNESACGINCVDEKIQTIFKVIQALTWQINFN